MDPATDRTLDARALAEPGPRAQTAVADTIADVLAEEKRARGATADAARPPVDRYDLGTLLGEGGMGRVYDARDRLLGRRVALKELIGEAQSVDAVRRFLVEALVTANLEHPGIVPVYERGVRDGRPFYTMRRLGGGSLEDAFARATTEAARLALLTPLLRVVEAVAYAHAHGVVHRDLKPANVILGAFGEVTVIDWGLAKLARGALGLAEVVPALGDDGAGGDATRTRVGSLLGTPAYMAPEQAHGRNDEVDARSDVFALGAMLYELLAGHAPYRGATVVEVLALAAQARPTPLATAAPRAPAALRAICERAMDPTPARRHPTARELARELEGAIAGAWTARGDRAIEAGVVAATTVALAASLAGGALILARMPSLAELGFGRYPIAFWAALAALACGVEHATRGRHRLGRLALVLITMTGGAGVISTLLGLSAALRAALGPAVDVGARWHALLDDTRASLGNAILGLGLAALLLLAWGVSQRRLELRHRGVGPVARPEVHR